MISLNLSRSLESIRDHKFSWIEIAWRHPVLVSILKMLATELTIIIIILAFVQLFSVTEFN